MASPARMKRRHWGLILSFFLLVIAPFAAATWYLWEIAIDQYGSNTGFTVRSEETGGAQDLLGGFLDVGSTGDDSAILYEYVLSPEIVAQIDAVLDLKAHYSANYDIDPIFSLPPDATAEDLLSHWERVVKVSYDSGSGLIDMEVIAFTPAMAQAISREIVAESQAMINTLNEQARNDSMRYANEDLEIAVQRLKDAREALTRFRTRTQIVDPAADLQGRMGVLANLQQQLAQALIDYDLLLETTTNPNDPRLTQAGRRIEVIRERIADERLTFASDSTEVGGVGEDYPSLIAEFESLSVDREVAEETYRAALTALDVARANASRQSRYLATYVRPTLPESAEYPQRELLTFMAALICFVAWSVLALIYYSVRDRS
ncbi:sugar transporter [Mesobacterium pallidum]|uniref:sugar transporter n=1 Tax=Mesobacterium pallidum TaxID=2872037 RepID=UPI001EE35411|nr:sugar transporter [Mesobacterium pallidum]